ncbi:ABC transporter permease [Bacillus sp. DX4.1]|uniref:ABC transporter permease n=1 Tax=Bacillus sp. DX4.1 TaxID=3055867 RepID=UPI0025A26CD9|nr:ABC transporter permease [Bacillus sp. DX4.1]MDM5186886.1 ABC transporter permease [Bacillus sp. DX4.1]
MIRIEYDRLVAIFYSIGVLLLIKMPGDNESIGEKLFQTYSIPADTHIYMNYKISNIWISSFVLQFISVLFLVKWLKTKDSNWLQKINKIKVTTVCVVIIGMPFFLNKMLQTLDKTWYYTGKKGTEAIEYKKEDSKCTFEKKGDNIAGNCFITLKNYQNHSQALQLVLYQDENQRVQSYQVPKPVYLHRHETKKFQFQIPVAYGESKLENRAPNIKLQLLNEKL